MNVDGVQAERGTEVAPRVFELLHDGVFQAIQSLVREEKVSAAFLQRSGFHTQRDENSAKDKIQPGAAQTQN